MDQAASRPPAPTDPCKLTLGELIDQQTRPDLLLSGLLFLFGTLPMPFARRAGSRWSTWIFLAEVVFLGLGVTAVFLELRSKRALRESLLRPGNLIGADLHIGPWNEAVVARDPPLGAPNHVWLVLTLRDKTTARLPIGYSPPGADPHTWAAPLLTAARSRLRPKPRRGRPTGTRPTRTAKSEDPNGR